MTSTLKGRRMTASAMLAAAAATTVLGALGAAGPADAASDKYIAVSYSQATGLWGRAQSTNLDAAIAGSLSQCGGQCAVASWSKNGCVALAVSRPQYWYGWHGSTLREAQQGALQRSGPGSWVVWSGCVK